MENKILIRLSNFRDSNGVSRIYREIHLGEDLSYKVLGILIRLCCSGIFSWATRFIRLMSLRILIAETDKKELLGFIALRETWALGCIVPIVIVKESQRGKGVGHALVEYTETFIKEKGFKCIRPAIEYNNIIGLNLYKGMGYKVLREILEKKLL
jgi:ribosomal protein S18 acetylase RimI-like enzyme